MGLEGYSVEVNWVLLQQTLGGLCGIQRQYNTSYGGWRRLRPPDFWQRSQDFPQDAQSRLDCSHDPSDLQRHSQHAWQFRQYAWRGTDSAQSAVC